MKKHYKEYTKEDIAIREVKKLKGFLRDEVYVSRVTDKGYVYKSGILMDVDGFVDITLDDEHIPFISEEGSINAIYTNDRRVMIFSNPYVNKSNYKDVEKIKREFYGDRVVDLQNLRELKQKLDIHNIVNEIETVDPRIVIYKSAIKNDSAMYCSKQKLDEWIKFIDKSIIDGTSFKILCKVSNCMKEMAYSSNVYLAVTSYLRDSSLSEEMKDYITLVLSYFSDYGECVVEVYNKLKENENKKLTLK